MTKKTEVEELTLENFVKEVEALQNKYGMRIEVSHNLNVVKVVPPVVEDKPKES